MKRFILLIIMACGFVGLAQVDNENSYTYGGDLSSIKKQTRGWQDIEWDGSEPGTTEFLIIGFSHGNAGDKYTRIHKHVTKGGGWDKVIEAGNDDKSIEVWMRIVTAANADNKGQIETMNASVTPGYMVYDGKIEVTHVAEKTQLKGAKISINSNGPGPYLVFAGSDNGTPESDIAMYHIGKGDDRGFVYLTEQKNFVDNTTGNIRGAVASMSVREIDGDDDNDNDVTVTAIDSAYYAFSEGGFGGGILDQFGDNDLTNSGATPLSITDQMYTSEVASFDGQDDYMMSEANALELNNASLTVEAWVHMQTDLGVTQRIVTMDPSGAFFFRITPAGKLQVVVNSDVGGTNAKKSYNSTAIVPANDWVHLACVLTDSEIKIYIDGDLDNTQSLDAAFDYDGASGMTVSLGASGATPNGLIDEVKIYNRALYGTEIEESAASYQVVLSDGNEWEEAEMELFPNPANGYAVLRLDATLQVEKVSLSTQSGEVVRTYDFPSSTQDLRLDMESLASGLYYVSVQGETRSRRLKLVVD